MATENGLSKVETMYGLLGDVERHLKITSAWTIIEDLAPSEFGNIRKQYDRGLIGKLDVLMFARNAAVNFIETERGM